MDEFHFGGPLMAVLWGLMHHSLEMLGMRMAGNGACCAEIAIVKGLLELRMASIYPSSFSAANLRGYFLRLGHTGLGFGEASCPALRTLERLCGRIHIMGD